MNKYGEIYDTNLTPDQNEALNKLIVQAEKEISEGKTTSNSEAMELIEKERAERARKRITA